MSKRFTTEKTNAYFYGNYSIVEAEINTSNTVSFFNLVDLTQIEKSRKNFAGEAKPTYTAYIAQAVAIAMQEFPFANRRFYRPLGFLPRRFQNFKSVDIAIASEINPPGVEYLAFIDILRDVEKKSLAETSAWFQKFRTTQSQNKQLQQFTRIMTKIPKFISKWLIRLPVYIPSMWSKYRGGAVLISSPAKYGVDAVIGSWTSPIGISFGYVKDRVVAKDGKAVVSPTFYLTFNFDRRLMAGAPAAKFMNRLSEILESWPTQDANATPSKESATLTP